LTFIYVAVWEAGKCMLLKLGGALGLLRAGWMAAGRLLDSWLAAAGGLASHRHARIQRNATLEGLAPFCGGKNKQKPDGRDAGL
jgi:hypothetical protein